jgi:hypothetical protein
MLKHNVLIAGLSEDMTWPCCIWQSDLKYLVKCGNLWIPKQMVHHAYGHVACNKAGLLCKIPFVCSDSAVALEIFSCRVLLTC